MTTQEQIRQTGANIAFKNEIFGKRHIEKINLSNEVVDDFIKRIVTNFIDFNTREHLDFIYLNLFARAFMYVYGKGAEIALFSRLGNTPTKINYDFDKAMQGVCGERLSDHLRLCLNSKSSAMRNMYFQMFTIRINSYKSTISENESLKECISTILNCAFMCGLEICLTTELTENENLIKYKEESDIPYNFDKYDKKYKIEDFNIHNFKYIKNHE